MHFQHLHSFIPNDMYEDQLWNRIIELVNTQRVLCMRDLLKFGFDEPLTNIFRLIKKHN